MKDDKKKMEKPVSPPKKLDSATIRAMRRMKDEEMMRKMGERYDEIMPSPEPGEAVPKQKKKMAYGGMSSMMPQKQPMMSYGGAMKKMAKGGMAMCGASVPPAQKKK